MKLQIEVATYVKVAKGEFEEVECKRIEIHY